VFHADTPRVLPVFLECLHDAGSGKWDERRLHPMKWIVAKRLSRIRHIEVVEIVNPLRRDMGGDALHQVTMGIDEAEAMTGGDVLRDERFQKCGFSGPCLSKGICVEETIGGPNSKYGLIRPVIGSADICWRLVARLHCYRICSLAGRGRGPRVTVQDQRLAGRATLARYSSPSQALILFALLMLDEPVFALRSGFSGACGTGIPGPQVGLKTNMECAKARPMRIEANPDCLRGEDRPGDGLGRDYKWPALGACQAKRV
jgi:hypothetical protein